MINLDNAEKEFKTYTNNFDMFNDNIKRKFSHSFRVQNISAEISKQIKSNEEEIRLSSLIGLLHDIGRFEQYEEYKTFHDIKSIDHGELGVKILENNNYIRKYIEDSKYDNIIKKAIFNHNKYFFEKDLDEKELLFSKILRDSDKLDIMYESVNIFWKNQYKEISKEKISQDVKQSFLKGKLVENKVKKTTIDKIIGVMSYIYDFNFKESFKILKEKDYINNILNRFEYKEEIKEDIEEIKQIANGYVEEKMNKG